MSTERFYITTPIFYPNGVPHIGHAYTAIATDVLARYHRLDGKQVFFLSGTDEHGQKMQQAAEKEGITPLELADKNSAVFQKMVKDLNCSNDDFIRTTEERHKATCQELWKRMEANGDIYLDTYGGWYSIRQEAYFDEDETTVDDDGVRREPLGSEVEWVEEESYFFRLSNYQDKLLEHYEANKEFIGPDSRRNEVLSFVKGGLRDLSVSRTTFNWGVPVPGNDKHVMYVWVDALTNYVSATGLLTDPKDNPNWPANLHLIGKDIIRFHAVYWPAFLMSAGLELPSRVYAHGFLNNKGEKMSKSVGNVVDPFAMIEQYGLDQTRYFFMREVPFGNDGSYSHEAIVNRANADLANNFGNLAQRSLSMIAKNCEGKIPEFGEFTSDDQALLDQAYGIYESSIADMNLQKIHKYLETIWAVLHNANQYVDSQAPWGLKKTDPARMGTVLYVVAEVVRVCAIAALPVMPDSCNKMLDLLVVPQGDRHFKANDATLMPGTELPKPEGVFPRYVEQEAN